jgi:hypothetical protein
MPWGKTLLWDSYVFHDVLALLALEHKREGVESNLLGLTRAIHPLASVRTRIGKFLSKILLGPFLQSINQCVRKGRSVYAIADFDSDLLHLT